MSHEHSLLSLALSASLLALGACSSPEDGREQVPAPQAGDPALRREAQAFLDAYVPRFQELHYAASLAEWESNTRIVPGDEANARRTRAAKEALAAFSGSVENIETARRLLERRGELEPQQALQLEQVLFSAADTPQTVPDVVNARIAAETAQNEVLYGFRYLLDGEEVTTNKIDELLRDETDLERRRKLWEVSKEVGAALEPGLAELRRLRNATVRALGYDDFFAYMASEYGMTTRELMGVVDGINRELRPLYAELHTWARHELAERYGRPVPDLIPAHWLPNRWGQDWSALVDVEGFDLDQALQRKEPEWLVRQAEGFYRSLGFEALPASFYERSSLYPVPPAAPYKKNNHASAWHLDLERDVRSLMSVEANSEWYETTHHELGHVYYYLSYTRPEVPLLLREGANRAYHEAVGSLMGLAAMQPRFVGAIGLADADAPKADAMQLLLKEALNYVVFIPWSAGVMSGFEKELYADELPRERWNERWWELKARYQGIAPPAPRGAPWCDAATKTHINDDPGSYYDYALSFVLLFQLHDHIAREILREDPHDTNYFGRREVGDFLKSILEPGATVDGQTLLRETTGSELSARAMVAYFRPLHQWLEVQNRGRARTLPEL